MYVFNDVLLKTIYIKACSDDEFRQHSNLRVRAVMTNLCDPGNLRPRKRPGSSYQLETLVT